MRSTIFSVSLKLLLCWTKVAANDSVLSWHLVSTCGWGWGVLIAPGCGVLELPLLTALCSGLVALLSSAPASLRRCASLTFSLNQRFGQSVCVGRKECQLHLQEILFELKKQSFSPSTLSGILGGFRGFYRFFSTPLLNDKSPSITLSLRL